MRFAEVAAERDYAARGSWEAECDRDPHDPDADGPTEAVIPTTDGPALVDLMRMSEDGWDAYSLSLHQGFDLTRGCVVVVAGPFQGARVLAMGEPELSRLREPPIRSGADGRGPPRLNIYHPACV